MIDSFVTSIISSTAALIFGYLTGKIKSVNNENKIQTEAIKSLLRSDMVRTYYKYKENKNISYYEKESWILLYESYKKLKGNSFIDNIKKEIDSW